MLSPDTVLQNRYRVIRQLGRGGTGTVYEALDQRVNAVVAIKETTVASNELARREFQSEAGLLANLQHPALPKVMDYFFEGGGEYLVMEYIAGFDLLELLKRRGSPFHVNLVMRWADAILNVLEYLHRHQPPILHRDIKPSNLKLTKQEDLFLLDFGLAKGAAGQMPTMNDQSVRGYTPVYSPLEQIIGQGTDTRSDIYSLGATLYHLLAGVPPTDAATRYEFLEDGKLDPLLPLGQLNPRVPRRIVDAIQKAMEIKRKDRFETAAAMRQALSLAESEAKQAAADKAESRRPQESRKQQEPTIPKSLRWRNSDLVLVTDIDSPLHALPAPSQPPPAPTRRKMRFILIAAAILLLVAAVIAFVLTRRSSSKDSTRPETYPAASPEQTVNNQAGGTARSPQTTATPPLSITESLMGTPLEMVFIPGGTFKMGSPPGEGYDSEHPQHQVTIRAFYMSRYEVTQAQYKALMGINQSEFQGDNLPVENATWDDAEDFCDRLSSVTGRKYRLPTEAEWEYACRAATTTTFAFGDSLSSAQANFDGNSPAGDAPEGIYRQRTTPVGSFAPNGFGLYDMHGNVWEWCLDVYHNSYEGAPVDGSAWLGVAGPRVVRGGSWLSVADGLRSAVRERFDPEDSSSGIGFRVVTDVR